MTSSLKTRHSCGHSAVVSERIAVHAAQSPDAIALSHGDRRISYGTLHEQSSLLAHQLRARGVGAEAVVGVCMRHSVELVIALLAVHKAGGCYLPIDPDTPRKRAQFQIKDSGMSLLICDQSGSDLTHNNILTIAECSMGQPCTYNDPPQEQITPLAAPDPDQAAYIIYTSGTSGQPKGCVIKHANLIGLLDSAQPFFQFDHKDRWTLFHSFAFDFSVWEIWGALAFGGHLVIVPEPIRRDPQALVRLLEREQITVFNQTPSAFNQVMQVRRLLTGASLALRYVIFGGEALMLKALEPWLKHRGDSQPQLINMYGITETTVHVTLRPIRLSDLESLDAAGAGSCIGRPLPGAEIQLLDPDLQPVPHGSVGEIVVSGWGVCRGYHNRDELTAARFLDNPNGEGRLYRSGDLGRALPNGEIVYMGRRDQQLKLRGYRIELAEIETALLQHPLISQARVICRDDRPAQPMLVAYVMLKHAPVAGKAPWATLVSAFLSEHLPAYMQPAAYVALEALPLTPNGKLDCQALPPPRLGERSSAGQHTNGWAFSLEDEQLGQLEQLGQALASNLGEILLAAAAVLLARWFPDQASSVAVAIDNSPMQSLRCDRIALGQQSFTEVLGQIKREQLGDPQPLEQADLLFSLQCRQHAPGVVVGCLLCGDLSLSSAAGTALIPAWQRLLAAIAADPDAPVATLPLLNEAEWQQVVVDWNATDAELGRQLPVHRLLEAQAARSPEAIAVTCGTQQLSYDTLNRRANRLAHLLQRQGVGPGVVVGICCERSLAMVVCLLAVLKSGGAFLPLDPDLPSKRLRFKAHQARAALVLVQAQLQDRLLGDCGGAELPPLQLIDPDGTVAAEGPEHNPGERPWSDDDPAYVVFTSGSTGQPKGALNSQAGLRNHLQWQAQALGLDSDAVVLLSVPFSFDPCIGDVLTTLLAGGRLVLLPHHRHGDGGAMLELVRAEGITLLDVVPSLLRVLLHHPSIDACRSVRDVVCGGEALPGELVQQFHAQLPWATLHNLYGPTEAAISVSHWRCCPEQDRGGEPGRVPIGRPVANNRLYVLDGERQPLPIGVPGELYIGGVQVGLGYVGQPELSRQRFIDDPFSAIPGARLYRSGDRACWRSDGCLDFLGRVDDQIKLRGQRIEPSEIEAVLSQHPAVGESAVVLQQPAAGDPLLVAYVVLSQPVETSALKRHLAAVLPPVMVPRAVVPLESMPCNSNGKLDRRALAATLPDQLSDAAAPQQGQQPDLAQDGPEGLLAQLWCELLGLDQVERHDNFFELGGHSLLAMQLQARLSQAGIDTDVASLYANPTIAALAAALAAGSSASNDAGDDLSPDHDDWEKLQATLAAGAADIEDVYPLTALQEGLLFHHRLTRDEPERGDPYVGISLWSAAEREQLERYRLALQAAVDRHPILRTSFHWEGLSEPLQVVWRAVTVTLETLALDPAAGPIETQLRDHVARQRPLIDVQRPPLVRLVAAHDPQQQRWLLLQLQHHLISDQVSEDLLQGELKAHLMGSSEQLPAVVPFRTAVSQSRCQTNQQLAQSHFTALLADVAEPTLPLGLRWDATTPSTMCWARRRLPGQLKQELQAAARHHGMSLACLTHLAWGLVLARYANRSTVIFGTVLLGRLQGGEARARTLGPCINTLPLRLSLQTSNLLEAAHQVQDQLNQLIQLEHTPLPLAQRCSGIQAPAPLFAALFNHRTGQAHEPQQLPGLTPLQRDEEQTHYPVVLNLDDHGSHLDLTLQVQEPIAPQRLLDAMATALEQLARGLSQEPQQPALHLEVLPAAERQQVLHSWNRTRRPYPAQRRIESLFADQVQREPTAIAIESVDGSLSYAELEARSAQLAERLREQGVGRDTVVGVCLQRSPALVTALLGVLKAGGAYLPLDPAMPRHRRELLLREARCPLLLERPEQVLDPTEAATRITTGRDADADSSAEPIDDPGRELAYICFTSGSTGTPKGVAVEHRSVSRLVINNHALQLGPGDRMLQLAPLAFDAATLEIWGPLLNGGTLVLHPPQQPSAQQLAELLVAQRITALWLTAGLFHLMVDEQPAALCQVRQLLAGGDRLSPEHVRRLLAAMPDGHVLINGYGPSENTTFTCCHRMDNSSRISTTVPIGAPISNTEVLVLNDALQPLPVGVIGELYIGGDGLARGYLHRPELSAERFILHQGRRLYRSGDLVSWTEQGVLLFHGRNDHQIKLRGHRIEPEEVEAALQALPGVAQALVLSRPDAAGEPQLIGYVVGDGDGASLREALREQLPEPMVPAQILVLESFPINANGKVDRAALPLPAPAGQTPGSKDTAFQHDPLGALVLGIWREVLGCQSVEPDDNFFALGGHSLAAARVVARLEKHLPTRLSPADLFHYPTARLLTQRLRHSDDQDPANPLVMLRSGREQPPLFVVHGMFGDVFGFVDVARNLPEGRPVIGVQMPRALAESPQVSLEDLAHHYADSIVRMQPQGPYQLMGGSAGGWVAYAVAAALQQQGQPVERLILLDTLANARLSRRIRMGMLGRYGWQRLTREQQSATLRDLRWILGPRWRREGLVERLGPRARRWLGDDNTDHSLALVRRYQPPRLNIDIDLLTPNPGEHWSLSFWDELISGEVRIQRLLQSHSDFFAPEHAATLARCIDALLLSDADDVAA